MRLESVGNAIDMAEAVAAEYPGADADYVPKPWFWSDQFDAKLQIAGLNSGHDRVVTRAGAGPHSGSVWYFRDGRLIAVDALNDARAYMIGKRLIESGKSPRPRPWPPPRSEGADVMRIVGGNLRGLKLADVGAGDPAAHLRPTTDRARIDLQPADQRHPRQSDPRRAGAGPVRRHRRAGA